MRKKIVAGNWKMNKTYSEGLNLFKEIEQLIAVNKPTDVTKIIAPPFIFIRDFVDLSKKSDAIAIAAQNCSSEESGAYTGEISAAMLKSIGTKYVIIGHSERRSLFGETSAILSKKVNVALKNELNPIFCIGESLSERKSEHHFNVIRQQLEDGVFHLNTTDFKQLIIAYEPVWAIGTGVTATTEQAQEMHSFIRSVIKEKFNYEVAETISLIYGGSCNANNSAELFACKDVDGGLIGGASLKAKDFIEIINNLVPKEITN